MNDDDLLSDAVRALRECTDGSSPDATRTRTAILARAERRTRRGRRTMLFVMPLAAALLASTAWGAVTGALPRLLGAVFGDNAPVARAPVAATAGTRSTPSEAVAPPQAVPAPSTTPEPPPSTTSAPPPAGPDPAPIAAAPTAAAPIATPPSAATPRAPSSSARRPGDALEREDALYSAAHRAHFVDRDAAGALALWDAYIAAFPSGRFAVEARYNRAISLVRVGRTSEAREALRRFADGDFGGYRQREARVLLDALAGAEAGAPP